METYKCAVLVRPLGTCNCVHGLRRDKRMIQSSFSD